MDNIRDFARVTRFKLILWTIIGLGAAVGTARFLFGLGATTNLSDVTPWGLWIGFDVMSGVALAGGGFVLTATVYIFKLEKYHSIVRPAVLTAFLGYLAVAIGLLFDLGLPWNIWHMIIFWNPHSPLFEVGWCVMLYLTVLLLEFFPVPAEEFGFLSGIRNFLIKLRLPLVIAGIALSTLHQSSLGSLFLIMPYNVHPLWYSPILPVLFFISAIGLGLMMVTFESSFTSWLYHRKPETNLLERLGSAARWLFLIYLIVRIGDLAVRYQLVHLGSGEWQVTMFWVELSIAALIPTILLSVRAIRMSPAGLMTTAIIGVTGIVLNRINVGGLVHINRGDAMYLPAWTEITITASVVAGAALLFLFFVEKFKVWEERPVNPDDMPAKSPDFNKVDSTWIGIPSVAVRTKYSLGFIFATAIGFAFISGEPAESRGVDPTPVQRARGGDTLWIDGNMDGYGAAFKHTMHIDKLGEERSCVRCHHMNYPGDKNSGCYLCHSDMYLPMDAFRHGWHSAPDGARLRCTECHEKGKNRTAESAKTCDKCHADLIPVGYVFNGEQYHYWHTSAFSKNLSCIECHKIGEPCAKSTAKGCQACHTDLKREGMNTVVQDYHDMHMSGEVALSCEQCHGAAEMCDSENASNCNECHSDLTRPHIFIGLNSYQATGYVNAMHDLCVKCHTDESVIEDRPNLYRCATCHKEQRDIVDAKGNNLRKKKLVGKRMILPPIYRDRNGE